MKTHERKAIAKSFRNYAKQVIAEGQDKMRQAAGLPSLLPPQPTEQPAAAQDGGQG